MEPAFAALTERLHVKYEALRGQTPYLGTKPIPKFPARGVYLFSEAGKPLYVGRTNNIRKRYDAHTLPGSRQYSAAFAMLLARKITNRKATYKAGPDTRQALMRDDSFCRVFNEQKARIRQMEFRWVEEADPVSQALLEIYCAVAGGTPYNDFDNH